MYSEKVVEIYKRYGSLRRTHSETGVSFGKLRKILLTAGIELESPKTAEINRLFESGMSEHEIAKELNMSVSAVNTHLPYVKTPYKTKTETASLS